MKTRCYPTKPWFTIRKLEGVFPASNDYRNSNISIFTVFGYKHAEEAARGLNCDLKVLHTGGVGKGGAVAVFPPDHEDAKIYMNNLNYLRDPEKDLKKGLDFDTWA